MSRRLAPAVALLLAVVAAGPAAAQQPARKDKAAAPLGALGGSGREPIKIDADRLDVFDRENKAIFGGNVVAVQGDSTIRCSTMTVHYKRGRDAKEVSKDASKGAKDEPAKADAEPGEAAGAKSPAAMGENGIQRVECAGPVTVVQKDQVATGDNAVFDQGAKRIVLTGNVVLSQCQNVTRGQRLVYDMTSGRANMDPVAGGRVSAMFVPGQADDKPGAKGAKGCPPPPGLAARGAPKPAQAMDKPGQAAEDKPADKAPEKAAPKTRAQAN